jgi:hypothetical protein
MSYFFLNPGDQGEKQPALRIDYNLNDKHRLTGTYAISSKAVRGYQRRRP